MRADADPLGKLGDQGVLVMVEPKSAAFDPTFAAKLRAAKRLLLILPKTFATSDPTIPAGFATPL